MRWLACLVLFLSACGKRDNCSTSRDCDDGLVCSVNRCSQALGPCAGGTCAAGYHCDDALHLCVEGASACTAGSLCGVGQGCVSGECACTSEMGCPPGESCTGGRCAPPPCANDDACTSGQICDAQRCVTGCRSARDCPAATPDCDPQAGLHGECRRTCSDSKPCAVGRCDQGVCVGCLSSADCQPGNVCAGKSCVAGCDGDRDCAASAPRCLPDEGPYGTCVACLAPSDCGGAACGADHVCANATNELDVLFVVDNSDSMAGHQLALAQAFPAFLASLGSPLPSLHVGVVSTDMGDGPYTGATCDPTGDAGILQNAPRITGCTPPKDGARFIADEIVDGNRVKNYDGNLADVFTCISRLGTTGCGLERHLDAVKAALDGRRTENAGFLRPGAHLAVIIFSDEDDCSARDTRVYDPSSAQNSVTSELGPYASYRCTEFGVRCDGAVLPRAAGTYTTCVPRGDSFLIDPTETATFLSTLKGAGRVTVGVIGGGKAPFAVTTDTAGRPKLSPACTGPGGVVVPEVRLYAFAAAFGNRGVTAPALCSGDLSLALSDLAVTIRSGR